jgi:hypothetical protein
MPIATLTAIGLGLAAASTAYQVKSSNDAKDDAEAEADKQMKAQVAAEDQMKQKQDDEAKQAASLQLRDRTTGGPRSSSINTSPLTGPSPVAGKQLLGL